VPAERLAPGGGRCPGRTRGQVLFQAADLNRAAGDAGIVLRVLTPQQDTLERIFLNLSGSTDAELSERRGEQRHGNGE
jgi:hypothetical protein